MRFLSSRYRTAAEVLLTVAVLAYVGYDLVDFGGSSSSSTKPSASSAPMAASPAFAASPAHPAAAPVQFKPQVDSAITPDNTIVVCNSYSAPTNPFLLGSSTVNQSLVFKNCLLPPAVLPPDNSTVCAAVTVNSGSWISLQNFAIPPLPGCVGLLTMIPGSFLEAVVPATLVPNPYIVQNFPLLVSRSQCPFVNRLGVLSGVANCPVDTSLYLTGPYNCTLAISSVGDTCVIAANIYGALSAQAGTYIQASLNKDCSAMTQTTFKALIASVIGVSPAAIMITYWQCSLIVVFTILGATTWRADTVLSMVYASMLNGQLRILLGVTSVILNPAPFPREITTTSTYAKPYYPMIPYPILVSSSNPALFALLSLLVIPIAVAIALLVWWCYRNRVVPPPEPVCIPQCCPPPMPMPMCCPPPVVCEPTCCAATMITPSPTPFTASPALYQPIC